MNQTIDPPVRVRLVADVVMPSSALPPEHQQELLSQRMHNFMHSAGIAGVLEEENVEISSASPNFTVHVHDASGDYCTGCLTIAGDSLS